MLDRRVRYLLAIGDEGGFRAASLVLGISQPALTRAMQELESELGHTLLERHARGTALTAFGAIFVQHARMMVLEERHARARAAAMRAGASGVLRVGAGPAWACGFLPEAAARLAFLHPGLRLQIRFEAGYRLLHLLERGEIDLCLGSLEIRPDHADSYRIDRITRFAMRALVAQGHPALAADPPHGLAALADHPWCVFHEDHELLRRLNAIFRHAALEPPRIAAEIGSLLACFALVERGRHVLCVADHVLDTASRFGLIALDVKLWSFDVGAIFRPGAADLPGMRPMLRALHAVGDARQA